MRLRPANLNRLALMSLPLLACNQLEAIEDSGGGGGGAIPPVVRTAFEESCGKSGCHGETGPTAPPLAGKALDNILTGQGAGGPLVTLGDTANSYIAVKMLPDAIVSDLGASRSGSRMPLDGDYLNPNNQIILSWIAGAEFEGGDTTDTTGDPTGDPSTGGAAIEPTFSSVQTIFTNNCACHSSAPGPGNGQLQLSKDLAYDNIVGVKSSLATTTNLIEPGDPSLSYLYLKLTNEYTSVPMGGGDAMPLGPPLSAEQVTAIEEWILMGAMNN